MGGVCVTGLFYGVDFWWGGDGGKGMSPKLPILCSCPGRHLTRSVGVSAGGSDSGCAFVAASVGHRAHLYTYSWDTSMQD